MRRHHTFMAAIAVLGSAALLGCPKKNARSLTPCVVSGFVRTVNVTDVSAIDVLFIVDRSESMTNKQAKIAAQIPRMIEVLTNGDINADGKRDFAPPAKGIHFGVVTTDMGMGRNAAPNDGLDFFPCNQAGDDGNLINKYLGNPATTKCVPPPAPEPFVTYDPANTTANAKVVTEVSCRAQVGAGGCGYSQTLESGLKALTPSGSQIQFINTGMTTGGRGDGSNNNFLRPDSLLAVILLTDGDDCSSKDLRAYAPNFPKSSDPSADAARERDSYLTVSGNENFRCTSILNPNWQSQALYDVQRYVDGLLALRPLPELLVFSAIVGVPPNLLPPVDLSDLNADEVPTDYAAILADPAMQQRPGKVIGANNQEFPGPAPACSVSAETQFQGSAQPAQRIVQLAQKLSQQKANAVLQSICSADFTPALNAILKKIASVLNGSCLTRELPRANDGSVKCEVLETLPATGNVTACAQTGAGRDPQPFRVETGGRETCRIQQIVPTRSGGVTRLPPGEGWYYDDFSDEVKNKCPANRQFRVAFSSGLKLITGSSVRFECLLPVKSGSTDNSVGIGTKCDPKAQGDAFCAQSAETANLICDDGTSTCQRSCGDNTAVNGISDALCSDLGAFVCDIDVINKGSRPICVNPSCGGGQK